MSGDIAQGCPRILIVDDRMESVALLLGYLKGQRLDVMVALGGEDGLRKAFAGRPDAVLLDVAMPGLDGYAVCRQLKADPRTRDVPVIFLSANTSVAHKLQGFADGAVDYIGKPFSAEEVLARLFVHLRLRRPVEWPFPSDPADAVAQSRDGDLIAAAVAELQRDGASWPGLAVLAQRVGTNEKKLTELFRQHFGMTAYEYLVDLRLEAARWSLANTSHQVQHIADRAGYQNASDFSRAFRQRYGLGPRQYRQASKGVAATAVCS